MKLSSKLAALAAASITLFTVQTATAAMPSDDGWKTLLDQQVSSPCRVTANLSYNFNGQYPLEISERLAEAQYQLALKLVQAGTLKIDSQRQENNKQIIAVSPTEQGAKLLDKNNKLCLLRFKITEVVSVKADGQRKDSYDVTYKIGPDPEKSASFYKDLENDPVLKMNFRSAQNDAKRPLTSTVTLYSDGWKISSLDFW